METRANYVMIGVFTLAVVVGVFTFVWWFQRLGTGEQRVQYEIVFKGPVSGLRAGAAVNFNGIRVGEVKSLGFVDKNPKAVAAVINITAKTHVRQDTKVALEYQGLTGLAAIALTGGEQDAPRIVAAPGFLPRIEAEPTPDAFQAAAKLMERLNKLVEDNQQQFGAVMKDLAEVTRVLAKRSDATMQEVEGAANAIRRAADNLSAQTGPTLNEYRSLASDARRAVGEIDRLVRNIERNPRQFLFNNGGTVPQYR